MDGWMQELRRPTLHAVSPCAPVTVGGRRLHVQDDPTLTLSLAPRTETSTLLYNYLQVVAAGFTPMMTPDLVRESVFEKCGFQPRAQNTQVRGRALVGQLGGHWRACRLRGWCAWCTLARWPGPAVGKLPMPLTASQQAQTCPPAHSPVNLPQIYSVKDSAMCLTGTAEIPLGGVCMDKILAESQLPMKMAAYGHCFRTEAGAAGSGACA